MNAADRFNDLQKQGFMKTRAVRKQAAPLPTVACDDCLNWHRKGKHSADAATRKVNRAARKEHAK